MKHALQRLFALRIIEKEMWHTMRQVVPIVFQFVAQLFLQLFHSALGREKVYMYKMSLNGIFHQGGTAFREATAFLPKGMMEYHRCLDLGADGCM